MVRRRVVKPKIVAGDVVVNTQHFPVSLKASQVVKIDYVNKGFEVAITHSLEEFVRLVEGLWVVCRQRFNVGYGKIPAGKVVGIESYLVAPVL